MDAQDIINQSEFTNFKEQFYPELFRQEQVDLSITKVYRDLR